MTTFFGEQLFEMGYTDLISVTPPGAQLVPSSKISAAALGKAPGRRLANGMYAGYDWQHVEPTIDTVRAWQQGGANIGLRANRFPAVDIDVTDASLAQIIEDFTLAKLGEAPLRVGRAPKRLLMYRTDEPFSRMRLYIVRGETKHLVEVLGVGQQYLVSGTHPATMRPYEWSNFVARPALSTVTRDQVDAYLGELADMLNMLGYTATREGDGHRHERVALDQEGLLAPSIEVLRDAVSMIPNTDDFFASRDDYIKVGYAIKAAAGPENEHEGFDIFAEWAARWDAGVNDPGVVYDDWRRMHGPYAIGWSWVAETARTFGFDDASLEFEALADAPDTHGSDAAPDVTAPRHSDQGLAQMIVARRRGELRYSPERGQWYVWTGARWQPDAELLADHLIAKELLAEADRVLRVGATAKEKKESLELAERLCSAKKASAVKTFVQMDRAIAVGIAALDHNPWQLNTPAGIVDLKTGALLPPDPDALCTKTTAVAPDVTGAAPHWRRFLAEATGGDRELESYLQRLAGYCLTGSTEEQNLTFIYGPGGNGKGTFINAVSGILNDYARTADMNTFTASTSERHSTDLAMLMGSRLVTASETQAGKRWDEQKVKGLSGGDPVTARFMRQDNFTFIPTFKLVFAGNHKPEIRDIDPAFMRRIQIVPFTVQPAERDNKLGEKLREEWPAILAWMIEGCLAWQREGLNPPARVRAATDEYFREEDAVGKWLQEVAEYDETATATSADLFSSWREWANRNGEFVGSQKRLVAALAARNLPRWRDPVSRRMGFQGLRLHDAVEFPVL